MRLDEWALAFFVHTSVSIPLPSALSLSLARSYTVAIALPAPSLPPLCNLRFTIYSKSSRRAGIIRPPPKSTWLIVLSTFLFVVFVVNPGRNHRLEKRRHRAVVWPDIPWISAGDRNALWQKLRVAGPTSDACCGRVGGASAAVFRFRISMLDPKTEL